MRDELAKHIFLHVLQFLGIFSSNPCLEGGILCPFLAQLFGLVFLLVQLLFCQGLEFADVEDIDRLHPWAKKRPDDDPRRPPEDEGPGNESKSNRQDDGGQRNDGREVTLLPNDDVLDKEYNAKVILLYNLHDMKMKKINIKNLKSEELQTQIYFLQCYHYL